MSSDYELDCWQTISDEQSYEAWIKFENPMKRLEFSEKYGYLLDNSISRPKKSGIIWIPVKTSDNADDVCVGLAGNLSLHYLSIGFAPIEWYDIDLYGREIFFEGALKFLTEHPKDTEIFVNTGLWAGAETVSFQKRYDYIWRSEFQYLGFVARFKGSDLRTLEHDQVSIVQLIERE